MHALELTRIGNSVGMVLPKELLARLKLEKGDTVFPTESPDGYRITPHDPAFEAHYAFGMARNPPFIDGNKCTAFVAAALFPELNGQALRADDGDCVNHMLALAVANLDEASFAAWLRPHLRAR